VAILRNFSRVAQRRKPARAKLLGFGVKATCFLTTVLGAVSPATRSTIERPGRNGSCVSKSPRPNRARCWATRSRACAAVVAVVREADQTNRSHAARGHWIAERLFDWSGVPTVHIRPTFFSEWLLFPFVRSTTPPSPPGSSPAVSPYRWPSPASRHHVATDPDACRVYLDVARQWRDRAEHTEELERDLPARVENGSEASVDCE
jgi:hypothetical protein